MKISSVDDIIKENKRRREEMFGRFNPITGEGSVGERVRIEIEDFPIRIQWIPRKMLEVPLVKKLVKTGSVSSFIENVLGVVVDEDTKEKVVEQFTRIRCRFDFPFWAATFVYIKDKDPGKPDCLFRLTYPQRKYLSVLEEDRLAGKPIRICMCKARQWGGSTETQMYMAWLQLCHRPSLNSIIVAHVNPASEKIKAMFRKMLDAYPLEMMHEPGESFQQGEKKLVWDGNSDTTQRIPQRNCTISVGSSESPNSARSGDYALAHISEIGLFKDTEKIKPADLIRSATSGILYRPYTMIVYESTADGVGTYFHKEYTAAADGKSQFKPFFMPWYGIELYQLDFDDEAYKLEFAKWLLKNMDNSNIPSDREESGRYLWYLWQQGATLEAINWYIKERTKYFEHGKMAAEFPTDAIEAFVNNGANVFDKYRVEPLRITCRAPHYIGDIYADCDDGEGALQGLRFNEDSQGQLWVWSLPDPPDPIEIITNRYLTVVDVGGRSSKADWSVIVVFDRIGMLDEDGKPCVVAQWYGHIDIDLLAWKAAQISAFYDNSLLVIESNTLETHDRDRQVDGDQSHYVLNQIKDVYPNLYARRQSEEDIRQGYPRKYGFHTNVATKPMIISNLIKIVREGLYTERDERCLNEMIVYERKPNGSFGAVSGAHDDLLMTRAIGLHICFNEMQRPDVVKKVSDRQRRLSPRPVSAATIS